jgi:hypothetical protein
MTAGTRPFNFEKSIVVQKEKTPRRSSRAGFSFLKVRRSTYCTRNFPRRSSEREWWCAWWRRPDM